MTNYMYKIEYLKSLNKEELLSLMLEHGYEEGYSEFTDSELIEQLSSIES